MARPQRPKGGAVGATKSALRNARNSVARTSKENPINADKHSGGDSNKRQPSAEYRMAGKAVKWAARTVGWKWALIIVAILGFLMVMTVSTTASTVTNLNLQDTVTRVLPQDWSYDSGVTEDEMRDIERETADEPEIVRMKEDMTQCLGEGYGQVDTVVAYAATTIQRDTKYDYARAWVTYLSSVPEARAALLYHHPELSPPDEGKRYTAEEITAYNKHIYTQDEIYYLYSQYEQALGKENTSVQDFIHRVSPESFPDRFTEQIDAVSWALQNTKTTPDSTSVDLSNLLEECRS